MPIDDFEAGDVIWVNLNPTRGAEKRKTRPCLVVQKKITALDLLTVLPITDDNGRRQTPFFAKIADFKDAGLSKKSVVDCYQIRTISLERVGGKLGRVSEAVLNRVKSSLALILEIHSYHIEA